MGQEITERQRSILGFIRETVERRGLPPSLREIGMKFGIRSTNGVDKHLVALERAGLITRERGMSRGIALTGARRATPIVPLLGRVAAGLPVLAPENQEAEYAVDDALFGIRPEQRVFALKVRGESMIDAHILDGDTVLVSEGAMARNGEIVVALVDGEATVKRFFLESGLVRLQPENSALEPIYVSQGDLRILGRVIGVMRKV